MGATKADGRELPPPLLTTSLSSGLYRSGKKKLPARAVIHIYKMNLLAWRTCGSVGDSGGRVRVAADPARVRGGGRAGKKVSRRVPRAALIYIYIYFHLVSIYLVLLSSTVHIIYIYISMCVYVCMCIIHIAATVRRTTRGLPRVRALDPVHQLQAKQRIISIGPPMPPPSHFILLYNIYMYVHCVLFFSFFLFPFLFLFFFSSPRAAVHAYIEPLILFSLQQHLDPEAEKC